ncbi:MAG: aldo/keto reductase [Candidatus Aminicenantes bacterium]|nr:aldo/keto reductase [Candidatus Aminicenantes bacterium]
MSSKKGLNRRQFIRNSALGVVGTGVFSQGKWLKARTQETKDTPKIKEYRTLGRTGFQVSDISSGGPMDPAILSALLDAGVNYIDTAESYGNGQSEKITGDVLKDRQRKEIFVTTKMGIGRKTSKEQILQRAKKSLERLQMDYVDCLMIHSPDFVEIVKNQGFHDAIQELKAEGRVKYAGISNHGSQWKDKIDPTEQVVGAAAEDGRFDVMLLVYNFVQKESGETLLKICKDKDIGVTLMKTNPVGGYTSAKEQIAELEKKGEEVPPVYTAILPRLKAKADKAEAFLKKYNLENNSDIRDAAIRFVLNNPGVHCACISFQNFDDVNTYVNLSGTRFSPKDQALLAAYKEGLGAFYCRHACGQCEPQCPYNVPVNTIMRYKHYFEAQGREKYAMLKYSELSRKKADICENCEGHCEKACPYGVPIQGLLLLAHARLTLA